MVQYTFPRIVEKDGPPTASDDITQGIVQGQPLIDTSNNDYYVCTDNTQNSVVGITISVNGTVVASPTWFGSEFAPTEISITVSASSGDTISVSNEKGVVDVKSVHGIRIE